GDAVVQGGGELEEQLVGDRVLVLAVRAPAHPAAAGAVPVRVHVVGVGPRGGQVAAVAGGVVRVHPGQAPPAGVVEVAVGEVTALGAEVRVVGLGDRVG